MMKHNILAVIVAALVIALPVARAQTGPSSQGGLTGSGSVVLKPLPDRMRMRIELFARGKSIQEALGALKERRDAVRSQLLSLGAAEKSISFGAPEVNTAVLQQQQMMEKMIRARLGNRGKAEKGKAGSNTPVVVSCSLTAEWPLKDNTVEKLLLATVPLQEKLKSADLSGKKEIDTPSSDDKELREELAGVDASGTMNGGNQETQPGEPAFTFVRKISDEEYAKAMAEAFQKAKADAESMAKAAGARTGSIRNMAAVASSASAADDPSGMAAVYMRMYQRASGRSEPEETEKLEAVGFSPGAISYRVDLSVTFELK